MQALGIQSVDQVMKVGDTVSDIKEGKNAGVYTVGVVEGSSALGFSEKEYEKLSEEKKKELIVEVKEKFKNAGADAVILNMKKLIELL